MQVGCCTSCLTSCLPPRCRTSVCCANSRMQEPHAPVTSVVAGVHLGAQAEQQFTAAQSEQHTEGGSVCLHWKCLHWKALKCSWAAQPPFVCRQMHVFLAVARLISAVLL